MTIKHSLYIIAACFFIVSCEKKLDLVPRDQISDPSFWQKPEDFKLAANDFYYGLNEGLFYEDLKSDIAFGSGANAYSNGSYLPQANSDLWDNAYENIRSVNYLLQKANESSLGSEIDAPVGEARFFRAYYYFNLVKSFGGVPLVDTVLDVNSDKLYIGQSTQFELADFMIADLQDAAAKLPAQSTLPGEDMGRVTKGAALALMARIGLYMGTWAKFHGEGDATKYLNIAIDAAEELIASNEYELFKGRGDDSYKYLFLLPGDDSKEVILAKRFYLNRITHNWTRELWFNAVVPTKNMADQYLAQDGLPVTKSPLFQGYSTLTSEFQNRDPRMSMTFIVPGSSIFFEGGILQPTFPGFTGTNATRTGYMIRKFLEETLDATQFRGEYDYKEFRYAEVLLVLAEALYERDGSISDGDLNRTINLLRERVNMPGLTNDFVTGNNLDMQQEIRRERTVELAYEGFRRDDLRRWKVAETVMPVALRGVKFVGSEYETRYPDLKPGTDIQVDQEGFIVAEAGSSRNFQAKNYLDPIPLQQIQLSKGNLKQNPGW
jgi:hypothetical protein